MTVKCKGAITYIDTSLSGDKVTLHVQGITKVSKSAFDWIGVIAWTTAWRFYDPYGGLMYDDSRQHSISPFASYDEAIDDFSVTLAKQSYYNVQLWGPSSGVLDTKKVILGQPPVVTPPPVVPSPDPDPIPVPPEPAPVPIPKPTPTPTPNGDSKLPDWAIPVSIAAIGIMLLTSEQSRK